FPGPTRPRFAKGSPATSVVAPVIWEFSRLWRVPRSGGESESQPCRLRAGDRAESCRGVKTIAGGLPAVRWWYRSDGALRGRKTPAGKIPEPLGIEGPARDSREQAGGHLGSVDHLYSGPRACASAPGIPTAGSGGARDWRGGDPKSGYPG